MVQDQGIGIPLDKQTKLFDAFWQADDSTTREHGGTGLGLAISSQLVNLMGGSLRVESKPNVGTKFWFTIKLTVCDTTSNYARDQRWLKNVRVLVLDDNATNREILQSQLRTFGATVSEAATGGQAIEMLLGAQSVGNTYGLLILDYMMPKMDGGAVIEKLKSEPSIRDIPTIILSSAGHPIENKYENVASVKCFLEKPVRLSQLKVGLTKVFTEQSADTDRSDDAPASSAIANSRILLAEDNPVNQEVALNMLESFGAKVTLADNGKEAFEHLKHAEFDVVLMDLQMPIIDGLQVTQSYREFENAPDAESKTPIIALTANVLAETRANCIQSGMSDYLSKPFSRATLRRRLESWLTQGYFEEEVPGPEQNAPDNSMEQVSAIDTTVLEKIRDMQQDGQPDLLEKIISIYRDASSKLMISIRSGLKGGDLKVVQHAAHDLKSSSANIGATQLSRYVKELESSCKINNSATAKRLGVIVENEYQAVLKSLNKKLD